MSEHLPTPEEIELLTLSNLVKKYNALAFVVGAKQVTKFTDRATGIKRLTAVAAAASHAAEKAGATTCPTVKSGADLSDVNVPSCSADAHVDVLSLPASEWYSHLAEAAVEDWALPSSPAQWVFTDELMPAYDDDNDGEEYFTLSRPALFAFAARCLDMVCVGKTNEEIWEEMRP